MPICTLLMKSAGLYDINYFFTVTPSLTREYNEKRKQWIKIKRYCEVERRVRSYSCTRKTVRIGKKESVFMMNSTGIVGIRTQRQPERRVPAQHCIVGSAEVFAMLNPPRVSQFLSMSCIYIPQDNSGKGECCQTNTWMASVDESPRLPQSAGVGGVRVSGGRGTEEASDRPCCCESYLNNKK